MLKIDGKTFMNIQEAVQWLLDNNALPFQSTANYVANTEIGMGTIVNPSPAKVRIGSLIFFADSKVSTVVGLTENGFMVSDQYNNLVDDIAYVTNVAINAIGNLITTLSDGQTIDAGQIKQVSGFSINASQHLIVSYNDGTTTDLGAIFSGNVTISGNLTVTGGISGNAITGNSIIENMTGYSFDAVASSASRTMEYIYVGAVKNGNKLTLVVFGAITLLTDLNTKIDMGIFRLPQAVYDALYPYTLGSTPDVLANKTLQLYDEWNSHVDAPSYISKITFNRVQLFLESNNLVANTKYLFRYEETFLLSENLAS